MNCDINRRWLIAKFREIQTRTIQVLEQLDDEDVNWWPNNCSNSIANLILHIDGYIKERIEKGILHRSISRSRDEEPGDITVSNEQLQAMIRERFEFVILTIGSLTDEQLEGINRTNLDMLHQCAAHFSEHVGQIFYIAKQRLEEQYVCTTGPTKPISLSRS